MLVYLAIQPWSECWRCSCLAGSCAAAAQAGEVHVAVAANFAAPMARIAESFTAATGHAVKLSSGATGKFYAQIVAGAPFELLLAADDETPKRLVDEGHAVAASRFTYATGRLVLWSATPGFVDAQGAVLASGRFAHLAIANPKVAPYGRAAMEVLRARGLGRHAGAEAGHRREHRAGLPVRCHRQCRAGLRRAVAGAGAGQAGDRLDRGACPSRCTRRSAGRGAAEARRSTTPRPRRCWPT